VPQQRTLPIPSEHRELAVKVQGQLVPRQHQLLAATVTKVANRISAARLVYLDGSASAGDFPLSGAPTFVPGREVEVLAGPANAQVPIFRGVVVRQSLRVRERTGARLVVDCRHAAFKLTAARRSACYVQQTDSDVITALLGRASIPGDVEATSVTHAQQVQFRSTDWDYLLARAEANGKLVLTNDARVAVKAPRAGGAPACTLQFGATILELDAEIDARLQFRSVRAYTWDPAQQALSQLDATDPRLAGPGNLSPDDLAAVAAADCELSHAALAEDEAQAWADAALLKAQLSKVSGRAKCEGIATVNPGDVVKLAGVGARCDGDVLVTGVRHDFELAEGWKTHLQFGGVSTWATEEHDVVAPGAGALLPAVSGLQVATVTSNEDSAGEHRVRVQLPVVRSQDGVWARVASLDAGDDRGFFFRPEIGDEVVVGFLDDDPRAPVILGMLHSSAKPAPLQGSDQNPLKAYKSRSGMRLTFDDENKVVTLETPAGNRLTLGERDRGISLEDQNGNKLELTPDGIRIQSSKALVLSAATELTIEGGTSVGAKAGTELTLVGTSSAELSSSAATAVKGSVVKLN
jgi:Rhs element Vgr protein